MFLRFRTAAGCFVAVPPYRLENPIIPRSFQYRIRGICRILILLLSHDLIQPRLFLFISFFQLSKRGRLIDWGDGWSWLPNSSDGLSLGKVAASVLVQIAGDRVCSPVLGSDPRLYGLWSR